MFRLQASLPLLFFIIAFSRQPPFYEFHISFPLYSMCTVNRVAHIIQFHQFPARTISEWLGARPRRSQPSFSPHAPTTRRPTSPHAERLPLLCNLQSCRMSSPCSSQEYWCDHVIVTCGPRFSRFGRIRSRTNQQTILESTSARYYIWLPFYRLPCYPTQRPRHATTLPRVIV